MSNLLCVQEELSGWKSVLRTYFELIDLLEKLENKDIDCMEEADYLRLTRKRKQEIEQEIREALKDE